MCALSILLSPSIAYGPTHVCCVSERVDWSLCGGRLLEALIFELWRANLELWRVDFDLSCFGGTAIFLSFLERLEGWFGALEGWFGDWRFFFWSYLESLLEFGTCTRAQFFYWSSFMSIYSSLGALSTINCKRNIFCFNFVSKLHKGAQFVHLRWCKALFMS